MKKYQPRHAAGSFELREGTGPIVAMCPLDDFLEIYKKDMTFRVLAPENVDPEETNPNAPFLASPVDDVGSANPIVARVLLQNIDILNDAILGVNIEKKTVIKQLHSCKESLIACQKVANRLQSKIDGIMEEVKTSGLNTDQGGRTLNPFPQVHDLDAECGSFLVHANRAIKQICTLPKLFLNLPKADSNFDHLAKRLASIVGEDSPLTGFIRDNCEGIRYLIDLRNYHEHPADIRTIVSNFKLLPDMSIRVPMWHLSDNQPRPIRDEMLQTINFLIMMAEAMLIHLVMNTVVRTLPYVIEEVQEKDVDSNNPIKYRLCIDGS
jgi:hypothetical protein